MFDGSPRRRKRRKILFFCAVGLVVLILVLWAALRPQPEPFQNVTPVVTPLELPDPTFASDPGALPEETDESAVAQSAENPVIMLLDDWRAAEEKAGAAFEAVLQAYPLRLVSFRLAKNEADLVLSELYDLFAALERGEDPGEWNSEEASVYASGGSYVLQAELEGGGRLEGSVSSTASRLRCTYYPAAQGTGEEGEEAETPQAVRTVEVVSATGGFYVQIFDSQSVFPNIRLATSSNGISLALNGETFPPIYENTPVNQEGFLSGWSEVFRATEGGGVVSIGGEETICSVN